MQKITWHSLLWTLLVVLACNVLFIFLFALWKASVFQSHPLVVFFIYGLILPSIHIAAMWAILGPGRMVCRQLTGMISLLVIFGLSSALAWLLLQQFDIPSYADEVARIMSKRSEFRMTQHIGTATCNEIIQEVFLVIPILFVICQLPHLISFTINRKQIRRENERSREDVTIRSLFFLTAIMAFSFSCLAGSGRNPIGRIALSLLVQAAFACVMFATVCWPLMHLSLADRQTAGKIDRTIQRTMVVTVMSLVAILLTWRYRLPRILLASLTPFIAFALPYGLLLMQIRRLGYRLGR